MSGGGAGGVSSPPLRACSTQHGSPFESLVGQAASSSADLCAENRVNTAQWSAAAEGASGRAAEHHLQGSRHGNPFANSTQAAATELQPAAATGVFLAGGMASRASQPARPANGALLLGKPFAVPSL